MLINNDVLVGLRQLQADGVKASMIFTSPPYNVGKQGYNAIYNKETQKWEHQVNGKYNREDDFKENYAEWIVDIVKVGIEVADYFFLNIQQLSGNKKDLIDIMYLLKDYYCDTIIWDKGKGIPNGWNERIMTNTFEYVHVFSKNPSKAVGTKKWKGTLTNMYKGGGMTKNDYSQIHKAQFPLHLPSYFIENYTNPKEIVIDCFMGLGTTGIACKELDREFIGIELDKQYFDIASKRIEEHETKQLDLFGQ